jgi:hypothetical protein
VNLPITYFKVEDVRLADCQWPDQIWRILIVAINENVLKILSGKELG